MSHGTWADIGIRHHRINIVKAKELFWVGPWAILPFDLVHDAAEPLGFLIARDNERLLYVTDTHYIPYRFKDLTHIMIETSYDKEILREAVVKGYQDLEYAKRVLTNHMSIDTAKKFIEQNTGPQLQEVYLLHLSRDNSNALRFKREIERITGRPVYV